MNLFGINEVDKLSRTEIARRSLNNLLTSYADEADVFNEIIQNAFDSVVKAHREGVYQDGEKPKLSVVIGRRNEGHHYFAVCDNGVGMSPNVAKNLTVPGFSFGKKKGKTVGYKGVGASYFFAASQKISLFTIDRDGDKSEFTVRGSYEWIKNDSEHVPQIVLTCEPTEVTKQFVGLTRGTFLLFNFHDGIKPKNLNNLVVIGEGPEVELKNWVCFLASKTALGVAELSQGLNLEIEVTLDLGDRQFSQSWSLGEFDRENNKIGYPFPHKVLRTSKSVSEIIATPPEQQFKHSRKYAAVHKRWTAEEIIGESPALESEEIDKLRQHLKWVDGYLAYSTDVMKEINTRLGGRSSLLRHGIRIAVDGIPQGRGVDLSLTSSQGLDRQSHIVMSFEGLELDTGRKISADEVVASAISKLGQRVVGVLKEYRWAMKKKDRPDVASDLETWRTGIESRSQTSLVRELFKRKNLPPVFRVDPDNESEVIALFVSLVGNGLLKGYQLDAISGFARYDALCSVDSISAAVTNLDDGLSVRDKELGPNGQSKVLEFKYSFDSLIQDFEEKVKNPAEIDFVVCWDLPEVNVRRGRIEPTYGEWRDSRSIYAGAYRWLDDNEVSQFPVLALRTIVAELLAKAESEQNEKGLGCVILKQIETSDRDGMI